MRSLVCGLLLAVAGISTALADPRTFHAGITRITVQDTVPFDVLIAYPTDAAEVSIEEGSFRFSASRDAPVAAGARFPVVLFSHGGGRRPGTPLGHGDLLLHLARQGFIVVAPFHPGNQNGLSSIGRDTFTRRSILCWRIRAFPTAPIPTGSA